jgi:hypothetical protein
MQHPDEGLIHTWLDGELSAEQAASLETHIAECAECSAKVAEARGLIAASSRIVSALDLVPSGVLPATAPGRRSWYRNTQLRAAAAVMIVAGASFLVMQNRDKSAMDSVMRTAASPVEEPARDTVASERDLSRESATVADAVAPMPTPAPASASRTKPVVSSAPSTLQRKRETAQRQETPASPPVRAQADEATALSGKVTGVDIGTITLRRDTTRLNEVVVTGVATAAPEPGVANATVARELRKIRTDTIPSGSRTTFEVSPGVEVTLTDINPATTAFSARTKQRRAIAPSVPAPPPAAAEVVPERDSAKAAPVNTISWVDKRGHMMTLMGPMTTVQLEQLRRRLPEDQR